MAIIAAEIIPKNSQSFVLLDDRGLRGGYRSVADPAELTALALLTDTLKKGMIVFLRSTDEYKYFDGVSFIDWGAGSLGNNLTLADMSDVSSIAAAIGEVLAWDGAEWVPTVAGSGNVSATLNIDDERVVRGDGGSKGIQESDVLITDAGNLQLLNDARILPDSDISGEIGDSGQRWRKIWANEIQTGDLVMRSDDRDACWRFIEHHDYIEVVNEKTRKHFRLSLIAYPEDEDV